MNASDKRIRSRPLAACVLCATPGRAVHPGLRDRLFEAPGQWTIFGCPNPECGLLWLNPMPEPSDLPVAYESYYTHDHRPDGQERGEGPRSRSWLGAVYHAAMDATGTTRARRLSVDSYLGDARPGRLLEVGCGDGSRLLRLKGRGWEVEGQDVDPKAAAHLLAGAGIPVHGGLLEELKLPGERYDVVLMNHVIEHAVEPLALLRECRRLLAPGGRIIAVTPNTRSFGHRMFGAHWMPLDPPRHLFLFSDRNLSELARKAGFSRVEAWTSAANAEGIGAASWDIARHGRHALDRAPTGVPKLIGIAFQIAASLAHAVLRGSGEEVVLRGWK